MCVRRTDLLAACCCGVQVNPATLSRIERLEQIPSIDLLQNVWPIFLAGEISEMQILFYPARFQSAKTRMA